MISYLEGIVKFKYTKNICVFTNSGVGYEVQIDKNKIDSLSIGDNISLYIYSHIKEDAFDLYGFIDIADKLMFEQLTSISGIGPKSALQILNLSGTQILYENVIQNNTNYLTQISGIGKKVAEKIVLELKDKLPKIAFDFNNVKEMNENIGQNIDVFEALKSMGYSPKEAKNAINNIPDDLNLSEKIKFALKNVHD